jgi:uncharacterized protein YjbI with pentapeptide repeats
MKRPRRAARRTGLASTARRHRTALLIVGIAAGVVALLWLVVVAAPSWFVNDDSLEGLKAQNEVRTTLLQGLAGIVLLVGVYFTWRQLHTAREGQITERYTRAIDQLGHSELDVRLGGIYALERIAKDSPADRRTIAEVLTAFIRTHAPWPPRLPGQFTATAPIGQVPDFQARAPDLQAALNVLCRGEFAPPARGDRPIDLKEVDLRRAVVSEANLQGAVLSRANLQEAGLWRTNLRRAVLTGTHLQRAILEEVNLQEAHLRIANLQEAKLTMANLQEADLHGANLQEADLWRTNLQEAHLRVANLQKANLYQANVMEADLYGANVQKADLSWANLQRANLSTANLQEAKLHYVNLQNADGALANLQEADLLGANLQEAKLHGANLMKANLTTAPVNLVGAGFCGNHCVVAVSSSSSGLLIQTAAGSFGGAGGLRTKRSGWAA